jgi:hypothetical protein
MARSAELPRKIQPEDLAMKIDEIKEKFTVRDVLEMCGIGEIPSRDGTKFRSPLRPDSNPSCSIFKNRLHDHSAGESYDAIDVFKILRGIDTAEAVRQLGGDLPRLQKSRKASVQVNSLPSDDAEKQSKRDVWPDFDQGSPEEIAALAKLRGISDYSLREASRRGWLRFSDSKFGRCWIVTDSTRKNAQARLLSGEKWPDIDAKAKTLPGSMASTPLGLAEISAAGFVGVFEGAPDWLAGLDLLGHRNAGQAFACIALIGSGMNLAPHAKHFAGKRVRIFRHRDDAGLKAAHKWVNHLRGIARALEIATPPEGFKDWNDLLKISQTDYEKNAVEIEESLRFGGRGNA